MKINKLPDSKQIPNCFSEADQGNLEPVLKQLTITLAEAGTTQLKNFPSYYSNYTNGIFEKPTLNCFYLSRDFLLLINNYNTDFSNMPTVFSQYVDKNFLSIHKNFADLRTAFDSGLDEDYGFKLN